MLSLPPQFQRELENIARKPFALLEIQSRGQSAEVTSEADWGTATSESNVDYTPTPPDTGDCILAVDTGTTTAVSSKAPPTTDDVNTFLLGTYGSVDEWPTANDADYLNWRHNTPPDTPETGGASHEGTVASSDLTAIYNSIPDNAFIRDVRVLCRNKYSGTVVTYVRVQGGIRIGGTTYWGATQNVTTSWVDYYFSWTTNPATSVAWLKSDILDLQRVGVKVTESLGISATLDSYCSQYYLEVRYYSFQGTGSIAVPMDLGADANTDNDAIVSIDDYVPTGAGLSYTLLGSDTGAFSGEQTDLGSVEDGSRVQGFRHYLPTGNFTSDGTVTGVLKSIKIEIPDNVYRFNNRGDDIFNSLPFLKSAPTRTIKLNLNRFMTDASKSSFSLIKTEEVEQMLQENDPFSDLAAELKIGFYTDDITEEDLVTIYPGLTVDYSISGGVVTINIKDPMETLQVKFPAGTAPATKPTKSYDGTHLCDVILDIADTVGTPSRWIDRGSLDNLKATVGNGSPAAANYVAKRLTTNAVTESKAARDHITEILYLLGAFLIIQESGKMTFVEYDSTAAAEPTWSSDYPDDFKETPTFSAGLDKTRDVCRVWYDYDGSDYGSIHIEAAAADSKKIKDIKSKWISGTASDGYYGQEIAEAVAPREINRLGSSLPPFSCQTNLDKFEVQVGDMVNIKHPSIVSPDDYSGDTVKFLVIQKTPDISGGRISWDLVKAS